MNKETYIPQKLFEHYEIYMFDINKTKDVYNLILKMWNEQQDLKQRIDKAIKLIEKNSEITYVKTFFHTAIYYRKMEDVTEVLEILKGTND